MTLWIVCAVMALAAAAFVVRPMLKPGLMPVGIATGVVVIAASFLLYFDIGSPELRSAEQAAVPPVSDVIDALAERLESEPENVEGWKMLGRSYLTTGQYREAADAFQNAVDLEEGKVAQTLVDLGESKLAASGQSMGPEIVSLFENALALEPDNPAALFWGGIASANRNDIDEAAGRWERLLATNPPPEIRRLIEQRVAQWRGEPVPSASPGSEPDAATPEPVAEAPPPVAEPPADGVSVAVDMPSNVKQTLPPNTVLFVIARDPGQPVPPIAVKRLQLRDLPTSIVMTDSDAMIEGRGISTLETVEVIARASLSGRPSASSGDWFGTAQAAPGNRLELSIDQQVP